MNYHLIEKPRLLICSAVSLISTHLHDISMAVYSEHESLADDNDHYIRRHGIYNALTMVVRELALTRPQQPWQHVVHLLQAGASAQRYDPPMQILVIIANKDAAEMEYLSDHKASYRNVTAVAEHFGLQQLTFNDILESDEDFSKQQQQQQQNHVSDHDQDALQPEVENAIVVRQLAKYMQFILTGYPNTDRQARLLQQAGVLASHVIYFVNTKHADMDLYNAAIIENYPKSKVIFADLAQSDEAIQAMLFNRLLQPTFVAGKQPPRRHIKLALVGAPNSLAIALAHRFNAVPIDYEALNKAAENGKTDLEQRLLLTDVRRKGFILNNYVKTAADATHLLSIRPLADAIIDISKASNEGIQSAVSDRYFHLHGSESLDEETQISSIERIVLHLLQPV